MSLLIGEKYTEDSVSGTTGNAFTDALDIDMRGIKNGAFVVENTDDANSLDYKVLEERANYAGGTDEELQASYTLAHGEKGLVALQDAHSRIKVQVKSTLADTPATYTIEYLINK